MLINIPVFVWAKSLLQTAISNFQLGANSPVRKFFFFCVNLHTFFTFGNEISIESCMRKYENDMGTLLMCDSAATKAEGEFPVQSPNNVMVLSRFKMAR